MASTPTVWARARKTSMRAHAARTEICAVPGRIEGDVVELEQLFALHNDRLVRTKGYPPHPERFERVGYDLARLLAPRFEGVA